jgi:hypothetical protein
MIETVLNTTDVHICNGHIEGGVAVFYCPCGYVRKGFDLVSKGMPGVGHCGEAKKLKASFQNWCEN